METREKIKQIRKNLGINAETLASRAGISKATLYRYENGTIEKIPLSVLEKIAQAMNCSLLDLTNLDTIQSENNDVVFIPVVGRVSAGVGSLAEQYTDGYESVSASSLCDDSQYIYLRVTGDSMYPVFMEGDLVLIQCCDSVCSGSYGVVIIDGCDGVIKKIVYDNSHIELLSVNPMYPPRVFEGKDMDRIHICGLVKEIKRKF